MNKHFDSYKRKITPLVENIIKKPRTKYVYEATMFSYNSPEYVRNSEIAYYIRQNQMLEGKIAQVLIGNWFDWIDLKSGHFTGLDCYKKDNSAIIELKNKYNTCNSSSQKVLLDNLSKYKRNNPKTECIWGIVNPKPNEREFTRIIVYDGVEIKKLQGKDLFSYVFKFNGYDYSPHVIEHVKSLLLPK